MGTVILVIVAVIIIAFVSSNASVASANKSFYNQLLDKGYGKDEARQIMNVENFKYQGCVSSKIYTNGEKLSDHLEAAIHAY